MDPFERAGVVELREGHRTPELRLPTLEGRVASLEEHGDKLVLVNFWATWCQPCTAEMPTLEALWREYRGRLVVLGVSVDRGAPRPLLDPYVSRLGLTFPILLDAGSEVSRRYQTTGYPESFLIDRSGNLASARFVGPRQWDEPEYESLVRRLLESNP